MMPCIPYLSYIPHIPYIWNMVTTPTIHTIANIHAIHTIPTIHTKHTILSKHAIPDRPYTPYIPNIPHPHHITGGEGDSTTPPPHHGGEGDSAGSPGPFLSMGKLLAAFLTTSFAFTRYMLPFRRPTQHTYSLKVPMWRLRATYSHIYMCYASTSYLLPVLSDNTTCV